MSENCNTWDDPPCGECPECEARDLRAQLAAHPRLDLQAALRIAEVVQKAAAGVSDWYARGEWKGGTAHTIAKDIRALDLRSIVEPLVGK